MPGERRAGQRVAVGVQAGGGEADDDVARRDRRAVDDRVEGDGAEAGAGDVDAVDHVAELGQLAAGDLDPGQLAPRASPTPICSQISGSAWSIAM